MVLLFQPLIGCSGGQRARHPERLSTFPTVVLLGRELRSPPCLSDPPLPHRAMRSRQEAGLPEKCRLIMERLDPGIHAGGRDGAVASAPRLSPFLFPTPLCI